MAFSTMQGKLAGKEYKSLVDVRKDFELICKNAMTYNRPGTVYHDHAQRMLLEGDMVFSLVKLPHAHAAKGIGRHSLRPKCGPNS